MRLDKFLTVHGLGTRSEVKKLIAKGLITMHGNIVKDAGKEVKESVFYKGAEYPLLKDKYYILLHKPAGYVCSKDEPGKKLIYELLNEPYLKELNSVGRLDEDTEGLLLLTNDGILNHHLMSPKHHVEKEYYVRLLSPLNGSEQEKFIEGIDIGDETPCKEAVLTYVDDKNACKLTLTEGRYHQVKRMFAAIGNEVVYLKRIRIGAVVLDSLECGAYRECTEEELGALWEKEV